MGLANQKYGCALWTCRAVGEAESRCLPGCPPRRYGTGFFVAAPSDISMMKQALELAERARGRTSPNPMVGAVLVKGGTVVGEGWHRAAGKDHAEIEAIKAAGEAARGSCLYVTLEPCCHTGRTGPCTEAILEAGVSRVVYAVDDINPRVSGGGAMRLRQAGLEVKGGVLESEARDLNEIFFGYHRNKRPWVVVKTAQTLDGCIATRSGDSQWISGPDARGLAHRLRAEVDAVVVGMGTVITDNPALTVRHVEGENPVRIILTTSLDFPEKCQVLTNNDDSKTVVATTRDKVSEVGRRGLLSGVAVWGFATAEDGWVDPAGLLEKADEEGLQSLLIEGGGAVVTSFLRRGLVDKWVQIIAPKIVGGGVDAVGDLKIRALSDAIRFDRKRFEALGDDMVFTGYPRRDG